MEFSQLPDFYVEKQENQPKFLYFFLFSCRCLLKGQIKVQSRSERSGVHFNLDGFFICPTFASQRKKKKICNPAIDI
jgi:hypothetical protein